MAAPLLTARTLPAILILGFASGLPSQLVGDLLGTWLTKSGWSTADVVLAGWITVPYVLKPLWAPLVDRFVPPFLGRRRGWLAVTQLALAIGIAALGMQDPHAGRVWLLALAAGVAVASATQDLAVNAFTCEALPADRLAAGAGRSVWGFRAGALLMATVVPWIAQRHGWPVAYAVAAMAMALAASGTFLAPEPAIGPGRIQPPASLRESVAVPIRALVVGLGPRRLALLLAFVLLYRLSDGMAGLYITPFLAERYDLAALSLRGSAGFVGAGIGVVAAAWLGARLGLMPCLWLAGAAQALSNLAYVAIADGLLPGTGGLVAAVVIDNACAAMAGTAFVALLMGFCTSSCAATQYALLVAVSAMSAHALRLFADLPAQLGWSMTFVVTVVAAVPGLVLLFWLGSAFQVGSGSRPSPHQRASGAAPSQTDGEDR